MKRRLIVLAPLIAVVVTVASTLIPVQPFSFKAYAAIPSDAQLQKQGENSTECKTAPGNFGDGDTQACGRYYVKGYKNPNDNKIEKNTHVACRSEGISITICEVGYTKGQKDRKQADKDSTQPTTTPGALTDNQIKALAKTNTTCSDLADSAGALMESCVVGYLGGYKGQDKDTVCDSHKVTLPDTCKRGYDAGAKDKAAKVTNPSQQTKESTQPADTTQPANEQLDCDATFNNPLSWIMCPLIDTLASVIDGLDHIITQYLEVATDDIFSSGSATSSAYHDVWQQFRNIALGMMIIAGLIIVISQALGAEILDAYTIRKTLPKLLIAAIAISISWPLMHFLIDASNWLGFGIRRLIYYPFTQGDLKATIDLNFGGGIWNILGGGGATVLGAAAGGIWLLLGGIGVILSYAATGALAVMIAILVLVLRQIAIIFLMLMAPLAIVMYALPNTEKFYKFWWESFSKALLMFPLIAGFIAVGRVFAAVSFHNMNGGGINAAISQLIGFISYFAPYFLIPLTFRFAGGFMRQLGGFVNDRGRGGFDMLRKNRQKQWGQMGQDIKSGQAMRRIGVGKKGGFRDTVNTGLQAASMVGAAGVNPRYWRGNVKEQMRKYDAQRRAGADREEEMASIAGYDDLARAVTETGGDLNKMDRFLADRGYDEQTRMQMKTAWTVARKGMEKKGYSHDAIMQSVFLSGLSAKTAYRDEMLDYDEEGNYIGGGRIAQDIANLSGGNLGTVAQIVGKAAEVTKAAGRQDEMPGFSDTFDAVMALHNVSGASQEIRDATLKAQSQRLLKKTIYKEGLSAMVGGTAHATRHLAPVFQQVLAENLDGLEAVEGLSPGDKLTVPVYDEVEGKVVDKVMAAAEAQPILQRQVDQVTAQVLSLQDVNGNLPPEKQAIVADLLSRQVGMGKDGKPEDVQTYINRRSLDPQVNMFKANYHFTTRGATKDEGAALDEMGRRAGEPPVEPPIRPPV